MATCDTLSPCDSPPPLVHETRQNHDQSQHDPNSKVVAPDFLAAINNDPSCLNETLLLQGTPLQLPSRGHDTLEDGDQSTPVLVFAPVDLDFCIDINDDLDCTLLTDDNTNDRHK